MTYVAVPPRRRAKSLVISDLGFQFLSFSERTVPSVPNNKNKKVFFMLVKLLLFCHSFPVPRG